MADTIEFSRNKAALNRCNKVYNVISIIIIIATIVTIGDSLLQMLLSVLALNFGAFFSYLLCGVIFAPLSVAMLFYSCYVRNDVFAYLSPVSFIVGIIFDFLLSGQGLWIGSCLCIAADLILIAPALLTNARYRYLEEQDGFPHFSTLLMEQQKKSEELKKSDPFEEAAKRRKLTESDSMNDLDLTGERIQEKVTEKNDYMDEI